MNPKLAELVKDLTHHYKLTKEILVDRRIEGPLAEKLLGHVLMENKKETEELGPKLAGLDPYDATRIRHHYEFLTEILEGKLPPDMAAELLEHVMEEHQEYLGGTGGETEGAGFTVGSLLAGI